MDHDPDFFPQVPIFCWSDPDFSFQLSGRSGISQKILSHKEITTNYHMRVVLSPDDNFKTIRRNCEIKVDIIFFKLCSYNYLVLNLSFQHINFPLSSFLQPDPQVVQSRLSRIKCSQVFDVFQLFSLLDKVTASLSQQVSLARFE